MAEKLNPIEELQDSVAKQVNELYAGLKETIWKYMKEHPLEDNVYHCIISPKTHNLILEEVECGDMTFDKNGQATYNIYAKKFHFEHKASCIEYDDCRHVIDDYEEKYLAKEI